MNYKTDGNRGPRRAGALAALAAAAAVVAAACGGSAPSTQSAPTYAQVLALVKCMRSHGVPNFPDPNASGAYSLTANGSLQGADGSSVDINSSQAQAAYGDCRHLVPGGPSISQLEQEEQQVQQRRAKMLPDLLKYVHCMRSHNVPNFPAPGQSKFGSGGPPNVNSPQYLAAASACQHLLPPGAKVSLSTSGSRSAS
jgi:hypothetical protein